MTGLYNTIRLMTLIVLCVLIISGTAFAQTAAELNQQELVRIQREYGVQRPAVQAYPQPAMQARASAKPPTAHAQPVPIAPVFEKQRPEPAVNIPPMITPITIHRAPDVPVNPAPIMTTSRERTVDLPMSATLSNHERHNIYGIQLEARGFKCPEMGRANIEACGKAIHKEVPRAFAMHILPATATLPAQGHMASCPPPWPPGSICTYDSMGKQMTELPAEQYRDDWVREQDVRAAMRVRHLPPEQAAKAVLAQYNATAPVRYKTDTAAPVPPSTGLNTADLNRMELARITSARVHTAG